MLSYNQLENEVIVVSAETIHKIFWYENGADAVSLYMFYSKQNKIQETNQSWTTTEFIKTWLWWGQERIKKAKDLLKSLDLIEEIVDRNEKWQAVKWYVKVNYIKSLTEANSNNTQWKPHVVKTTCCQWVTNAWSSININAWSSEKEKPREEKISRIKKKNPKEETVIVIPTREEIYSFIRKSKGVEKFCDILEETNIKQSLTLEQVKEIYEWMVWFFAEKYDGRFYKNEDGSYTGIEIVFNELDKFISHFSWHAEKEILNLKSRLRLWITNSVSFNQKR